MSETADSQPSIEETQAALHDAIERTRKMAAETRRRLSRLASCQAQGASSPNRAD